ncbi:MAG: DUF3006 domain-containing protein [Clostridium sp.]|jgi:hypothetical protein|nr:DUF3006 domain-containing protein [Clostridium sp.]
MKYEKFIVNRTENNFVVLEDYKREIILIDINLFNKKPKDGDIVIKYNNLFYVDYNYTREREEKINSLMKGMWE